MPSDKYDLIGRLKAVEREHTALRFTTDHVLRSLGEGGIDLDEDLKRLDVKLRVGAPRRDLHHSAVLVQLESHDWTGSNGSGMIRSRVISVVPRHRLVRAPARVL